MQKIIKTTSILTLISLLIGGVLIVANFQSVYDWVMLRGYTPPNRVVEIADTTTMTDGTRRVFYVNQPQIDGKDKFKTECKATEQTIVLGCYVESQGIFLLDVKDQRLAGVMEVTAAHEVLHAEYDRLDNEEKREIDKKTTAFFATLSDERLKSTIENYRKKDPSIVSNELHSILATEVRDLPADLEAHYRQFFVDRKAIVDRSEHYEQVFNDLKAEQDRYIARLDQIKAEFNTKLDQLNRLEASRVTFKNQLDSLRNEDRIGEYNARVDEYNSLVTQRNALVPVLKALSAESEDIVSRYNNSVVIYQGLIEAIDANAVPKAL